MSLPHIYIKTLWALALLLASREPRLCDVAKTTGVHCGALDWTVASFIISHQLQIWITSCDRSPLWWGRPPLTLNRFTNKKVTLSDGDFRNNCRWFHLNVQLIQLLLRVPVNLSQCIALSDCSGSLFSLFCQLYNCLTAALWNSVTAAGTRDYHWLHSVCKTVKCQGTTIGLSQHFLTSSRSH